MKVEVLRLGHRIIRDQRVTTHVGLVARAFGANSMIFCGQRDEGVIETINKVVGVWRWTNTFFSSKRVCSKKSDWL